MSETIWWFCSFEGGKNEERREPRKPKGREQDADKRHFVKASKLFAMGLLLLHKAPPVAFELA